MAQFYAEISGARGPASRLGSKQSGIRTSTKSWAGEVNVRMWHEAKSDTDMVHVTLGRHGGGASILLFTGPVNTWEKFIVTGEPVGELSKRALLLDHMPLVQFVFDVHPSATTTTE